MNRIVRQLLVCTVLGMVTTIVVAWAITARTWMSVSVHWTSVLRNAPTHSAVKAKAAPPSEIWHFGFASRRGASACISWTQYTQRKGGPVGSVILDGAMVGITQQWDAVRRLNPAPPAWTIGWRDPECAELEGGVAYYHEFAAGWPLLAVRWMRTVSCTPVDTQVELFGGINRPSWLSASSQGATFPFWPIWAGFAGNTALYGAAWFVLLFGFSNIRRIFRKKVGSCPECGYDMRGSPSEVCPECGKRARALSV